MYVTHAFDFLNESIILNFQLYYSVYFRLYDSHLKDDLDLVKMLLQSVGEPWQTNDDYYPCISKDTDNHDYLYLGKLFSPCVSLAKESHDYFVL